MRKLVGIISVLLLNNNVYADDTPNLILDKVQFQVSAKQWVNTQTALLRVKVNATLSNADLVSARKDIMKNLQTIASGDWHLTQFDRNQDNSGLEKLEVLAEIRVGQDKLTHIYDDAKKVSKPGTNFQVNAIEFKPDLIDIQLVKTKLREQLYQQIKAEIARINAVYNTQLYTVSRVDFIDGDTTIDPNMSMARKMNTMSVAATSTPLTVSNELTMTAVAEAASNRQKGN